MHEDPATTQPPRITDTDDAHVGRDPVDALRPAAIGEDRSPNAWVCPFLRSIDDDRRLGLPVEAPDPINRCAALHDPVPQSLRQQELVCLTSGHVNCPRYLRGSHAPTEPVAAGPAAQVVTPAIAGSVTVLVVAFLLSIAFVVANGGLTLTAAAAAAVPVGRRPRRGRARHRRRHRPPTADATRRPRRRPRRRLPTATPLPTPTADPDPDADCPTADPCADRDPGAAATPHRSRPRRPRCRPARPPAG